MAQEFLNVIDADEAQRRFREALRPAPLAAEEVPLAEALGRVLAEDVVSPIDVPGFDRSNVDGFAVQARDTFGATDESPRRLSCNAEEISPGVEPLKELSPGTATPIATGGMIPRGADAVVMIEHAERDGEAVLIFRPATPGARGFLNKYGHS